MQKPAEPEADAEADASSVIDIDEGTAAPPPSHGPVVAPVSSVPASDAPAPVESASVAPSAQEGTETVSANVEAADLVVGRPMGAEPAQAASARKLPAPLAAVIAAALLGGVSLFVGYRLMNSAVAPTPPTAPASLSAAAAPAEPVYTPPKVTFGDERVVIAGQAPPPSAMVSPAAISGPVTAAAKAPVFSAPPAPDERAAVKWSFRGEAFDLMTGEPVFAAKLTLIDAKGAVVGSAETGTNGRYELTVLAGPSGGYQLKIERPDYLERCIDQGAGTGALRQATPDERTVLVHAAHGRPWVGAPGQIVVHDLALIPKSAEPQ
ncbi:MAG: hypothetical protein HKL90_01180 [Elusimicrobia bacterium]|nr:hypothetical protein [Elusimicrobiota bacterium]